MSGFSSTPSNYPFLKKLRQAKTASLKPCPYLKPTTQLRDYQVIGVLHLLSLARMILGDGVGLGKCVSIGTYISTSTGLKRLLEFLPDNPKEDTTYPFSGNCKLLTINGPVEPNAIYYCGKKAGLRIKTQKGYELIGLPHHPLYVPVDSFFKYKRLDSLNVGDYVCINRRGIFPEEYSKIYAPHTHGDELIPRYLNEDLAELLGFYVSEGHKQKDSVEDFPEKIGVNSIELTNLFKYLGVNIDGNSGDQIVPEVVLNSPESVVGAFLRGYFEGDGFVENVPHIHGDESIVSCASKSEQFINQIQQLLLGFGIISLKKSKMVEEKRPYHILCLYGKDISIFSDKIGFVSERKKDAIKLISDKNRNIDTDIIPAGKALLKIAIKDITTYIKNLPEQSGFSGWEDLLKRMLEEVIYKEKRLTYELLRTFLDKVEELKFTGVVSNYKELKEIQEKNFYFDRIVSVEPVKEIFADFHVPEEHNFIGNGFVNHNTLQMITGYIYRLMSDPNLKMIVVTPKSAMAQWAEEFDKFCNGISVHVLKNEYGEVRKKGPQGKMVSTGEYGSIEDLRAAGKKCRIIRGFKAREAQYKSVDAHVLIINYYAVQEDYTFLIKNRGPVFQVAFDEAQEFKNMKTKTWFGASEISAAARYCYGMSATIIKNRLEEAYYIYRVIVPGLFPGKIKFFAEYTVRKKMTLWRKGKKRFFNKIVGYKNLATFKRTIDPFFLIRRTRDVASELPHLISRKLTLEMSEAQEHLYRRALSGELYQKLIKEKYFKFEEFVAAKEDLTEKEEKTFELLRVRYEESLTKEGLEKNKIAALSYCQLVSNGPGWLNEDGESSKETEFRRLFDQELTGEKVIVFTRFKSGIKRLSAILDDLGMRYVRITGDDSIDERQQSRKLFQDMDQNYNVIFITQAGSAAINLQAAGVILYYDTPWSYGDLYQSIGRAQRIGSIREHILLLHMVNKKTIDEHVLDILDSKKDLINQIVGDIAEGALAFKDNNIMFQDDESSVSALYNSVFK